MLFNSFIFFIFLGVVLPIYYALPSKNGRNLFLLIGSYFFYGYWDWRFCTLLAASTIIDFFIGLQIEKAETRKKKRIFSSISIISNLSILAFFKYFNFFIDSFKMLADGIGFNTDFMHMEIILPVGISFYTFQTLSYSIDIYRGNLKPTNNFIDFALFVSFFPQLVAGPIERAKDLLPQISKKQSPTRIQIEKGIILIVTGLFKKVMIGDTSGRFVDHIFANIEIYSSWEVLCGLILFSIQIYADFSGYSSIARGTAKLLGYELMKNFEQPYLSRNITEFWRRWHISLSSWLKDYLYISLGGNRKSETRTKINLFITMLLGGLWHGASWNFIIWGGLHGFYLSLHKFFIKGKKVKNENEKITSIKNFGSFFIKVLFTYILVLFAWLFFRATDWHTTKVFFEKMVFWEQGSYTLTYLSIIMGYLFITFLIDGLEYMQQKHTFLLNIKSKPIEYGILTSLFIVSMLFIFQSDPLPFVYFQF